MKTKLLFAILVGALSLSACVLGSPNLTFEISDAHAYSMASDYYIEGYLRNNGTETARNVQGSHFLYDSAGRQIVSYRVTSSTTYPSDIPPGYSIYVQIQGYSLATAPRSYTMTASYQDWRGTTMSVSKNAPFAVYPF